MTGPRILFVKLSSLGDVVHNLPAVTDLAERLPGAHIAWAVEAPYAGIVRLHPAVAQVIPVALRHLRSHPASAAAWRSIAASRREIRAQPWDYVIDTQGLIKSAWIAGWARGPRFGLDRATARERLAARFYDVRFRVPRALHAVERNRRLAAEVFGHALAPEVRYGLVPPRERPPWAPERYVVMLHAASRASKRWPEARWTELARRFQAQGYTAIFPGGTAAERAASARLAAAVPGALAAPAMSLEEAAALLANAAGVIGVDTGLTHLAVALGVPTIGIYGATRPALTGLHGGERSVNLGGPGAPPGVDAVAAAAGIASAGE